MAKIKSFGTSITVATNIVGGLNDISNGGISATIIDVTSHDSADNSKEFISGLLDGGSIALSGHYDYQDVGQDYIRDNIGGAAFAFVITYSNGTKISGNALIESVGEGAGLDDSVAFNATLKITGKPTRAAS
jgi:predicted secreted protein